MPHENPPDAVLLELLREARTIAVVGASSKPERASHGVTQKLIAAGYRVLPVNPSETEILGLPAYRSLADVPGPVDVVDVFRRSEDTPAIADEAIAIGAKALWLQVGISSEEAAAKATAAGLTVVMDACIAVAHGRLGVGVKG